jgi:hypothetical protein
MKGYIGLLLLIVFNTQILAQTAPTNFVFTQRAATPFNYTANGYGNNYSTSTTYNIYFGIDASSNPTNDVLLSSFDIGGETYKPITLSNGECYTRVTVNRIANANVSDLDKQTLFFERSSRSGNDAYFTPTYANIQEAVNTRIMNRGGDNVFYNDGSDQTKNNIERIDLIIDGGVFSPDNTKAGFVINERGGNDNFKVAAITSLDGSGNVSVLGSLVSVSASQWGNTGKSVLTTVFQRGGSDTYMRPNQDLSAQDIHSIFISYSDLGIANNVTIYGIAVFPDDVNGTMDLIGLSDVPLNTASSSNPQGGLDLMGGGGYFGSESVIVTDLEVQLSSNDMAPEDGMPIQLSIQANNNGPLLDSNIIVTTTIPTGFTYNSIVSSNHPGNVSVVGNTITWTFDELVAYDNEVLVVQLTTLSSGGRTFNSSITGDKTDVNPGNNNDALEVQSSDEVALPVEWLNLSAEFENTTVNIKWTTASEINNSRFEIQRSKDSKEFETIGFVGGSGNSNQVRDYEFTDYSPNNAILYYRIKQVDYDGSYDFSEVLVVKNNEFEAFKVYPNPSTISVNISGLNPGEYLEVYNSVGKLINNVLVNSENINLSLDSYPAGVYYIKRKLNQEIIRLIVY